MKFDLLLVPNYDLFRRFDAHFVSEADLENYWAPLHITIEQIVRLQERMHFEKFPLDQIHLDRPDIG